MILPKDMQVVVLLGGLGTRLKGIAAETPKSLIDVCGKPFFQYQLEIMKENGFRRFLFCVGHRGDLIRARFGDGLAFGVDIGYSDDGDTLLGTGGALRNARDHLDEDFVLIYGDSFMDVDYTEIIYEYARARDREAALALMTVLWNQDRLDKSNVRIQGGHIIAYDKRNPAPGMEHIDYGIAVLNKNALSRMPANGPCDLADLYADLVRERRMACCLVENRFYEIGTPDSLSEFRSYARQRFHERKRAVFLDRDGTITRIVYNEDTEQLDSPLHPDEVELLPGAAAALKLMADAGYVLIVVTNQPAAAKGKTSLGELFAVNRKLREILGSQGARVQDILMCPHHPRGDPAGPESFLVCDCECRKPKPGLALSGIRRHGVDPERSFMVGDSHADMLAGRAASLATVFVGKFKCDACQLMGNDRPDHVFPDLLAFARSLARNEPETDSGTGQ